MQRALDQVDQSREIEKLRIAIDSPELASIINNLVKEFSCTTPREHLIQGLHEMLIYNYSCNIVKINPLLQYLRIKLQHDRQKINKAPDKEAINTALEPVKELLEKALEEVSQTGTRLIIQPPEQTTESLMFAGQFEGNLTAVVQITAENDPDDPDAEATFLYAASDEEEGLEDATRVVSSHKRQPGDLKGRALAVKERMVLTDPQDSAEALRERQKILQKMIETILDDGGLQSAITGVAKTLHLVDFPDFSALGDKLKTEVQSKLQSTDTDLQIAQKITNTLKQMLFEELQTKGINQIDGKNPQTFAFMSFFQGSFPIDLCRKLKEKEETQKDLRTAQALRANVVAPIEVKIIKPNEKEDDAPTSTVSPANSPQPHPKKSAMGRLKEVLARIPGIGRLWR